MRVFERIWRIAKAMNMLDWQLQTRLALIRINARQIVSTPSAFFNDREFRTRFPWSKNGLMDGREYPIRELFGVR